MGCTDMLKELHPKFHHLSNAKCAGLPSDAPAQIFVKFIRTVQMSASPVWAGQRAGSKQVFTVCFNYVYLREFHIPLKRIIYDSRHESHC